MTSNQSPVTGEGIASRVRTDQDIIGAADVSVRHRVRIELQIARKTILTLREAGFDVLADNGEDKTGWNVTERELIGNLFACDEAHLITRKEGKTSFVFFVLGNDGFDVINDYGVSLEPQLSIVNQYADRLEAEGR